MAEQYVGFIQKIMHGGSHLVEYFVAYEYIPSGLRWLFQQFQDYLHDERDVIYEVNLMSRGAILRIKNANEKVCQAIEHIAERNRYQVGVRFDHDDMNSPKHSQLLPDIREIIQNGPATIIKWADDTKTVVKLQDKDRYNPMLGVMLCISKKAFGRNHLTMLKDKMDLSDEDFDALFTEALHPKPKSQLNNGKTSSTRIFWPF